MGEVDGGSTHFRWPHVADAATIKESIQGGPECLLDHHELQHRDFMLIWLSYLIIL